jgi:hypothetical protein
LIPSTARREERRKGGKEKQSKEKRRGGEWGRGEEGEKGKGKEGEKVTPQGMPVPAVPFMRHFMVRQRNHTYLYWRIKERMEVFTQKIKNKFQAESQWLTPIILATQEAEIKTMAVRSWPRQTVWETLSRKKTFTKKGHWSGSKYRLWGQAQYHKKINK